MAFTLVTKMAKNNDDLYYTKEFRLVIETHLNVLKNRAAAITPIPLDQYYQYEGDFFGYLVELNVPPAHYFIYLRMNGMTNPNQFGKEMRNPLDPELAPMLLTPNPNMIDTLVRYHMSRKF